MKYDCDCLLIIVRFVTNGQLVQGVSCLLPSAFWETVQPVVQDFVQLYLESQHTRLILFMGLIFIYNGQLIIFTPSIISTQRCWFYRFTGCQVGVFGRAAV